MLVSKSQLYIPGRRSKVRSLSIYLFIRQKKGSLIGFGPNLLRGVTIAGVISRVGGEGRESRIPLRLLGSYQGNTRQGRPSSPDLHFIFKSVSSIRWRGINKTFRGCAAIWDVFFMQLPPQSGGNIGQNAVMGESQPRSLLKVSTEQVVRLRTSLDRVSCAPPQHAADHVSASCYLCTLFFASS